jgi:hypothetical protein
MKTMLKNKIPSIMIFTITALSVLMTINIVNQLSNKNESKGIGNGYDNKNAISIEYYQIVNEKNSDIEFAPYKATN